jgi:hypothetical protein
MKIMTVAGTPEDIADATGYMVTFRDGRRQYLATTSKKLVFGMCANWDAAGETVEHARLCIRNGNEYVVLA